MKLYSFTVLDEFRSSPEEIYAHVQEILKQEASEQGWADDYKYDSCRDPEHLPNGSVRYFFEVFGKYLEGDGEDKTRSGATTEPEKLPPWVAQEARF
ncbi:MAG: hypothetical protein RI953_874 [Pseudomonadota bacterium]|jgi:hypothetical protein